MTETPSEGILDERRRASVTRASGCVTGALAVTASGNATAPASLVTEIVPNEKAPDAPDRVSDGERRRRRGESLHPADAASPHHPQAGEQAAHEPAEPAHAAPAEEQTGQRPLIRVLDRPQQLGAHQPAEQSGDCRIHTRFGQRAARELLTGDIHRPTSAARATMAPKLVTSKSPILNSVGYMC